VSKKERRKGTKKQLGYIKRNLSHIAGQWEVYGWQRR
jgi:hypothetical protein